MRIVRVVEPFEIDGHAFDIGDILSQDYPPIYYSRLWHVWKCVGRCKGTIGGLILNFKPQAHHTNMGIGWNIFPNMLDEQFRKYIIDLEPGEERDNILAKIAFWELAR